MKVAPVCALNDNYIWMIIDETNHQAFCVDPGEAKPVIDFIESHSLKLQAILLTHHHWDHIAGVESLLKTYPKLKVYGPNDSRIPFISQFLLEQDRLSLSPCEFQILSTPGHTSTHLSLYEPHYGWLFCGDTLFSAGCGRVFDGTIEQLYESLAKLKALPEETKVFCAHEYTRQNLRFAALMEPNNLDIEGYAAQLSQSNQCTLPSTIGLEKKINPFLRTHTYGVDSFGTFKYLRAEKDKF